MGRLIAGGIEGGEGGAAVGTVEPGGGNAIGAVAGAVTGAVVAAVAPQVFSKSKDAFDTAVKHFETALEHLGKLNNDPAKDPRNGWKNTMRKSADNIDRLANKVSNQNVARVMRSTAVIIRVLIPED